MENLLETVDEIRRMSEAELAAVAEDGLTLRLREQATLARQRYGGLTPANLGTFLEDRQQVRYPVRLVLEFGEMGVHQFAQPEPDVRGEGGIMLYLRPSLGKRPDLLVRAVAYMIPVINFGKLIGDEHCVIYGATLFGDSEDEFYQSICDLADWLGVEAADAPEPETCACH